MPPRFDGEAESVTSYIFTPFQVRQAPYMAGLALLSDKGETRFGSSTSVGSESVPSALHSLHLALASALQGTMEKIEIFSVFEINMS